MASVSRRARWPFVLGGIAALVLVAVLLFRWDWLIPIVESQAAAALGRPVKITHLHVDLGRKTRIEAEGITIANPPGWEGGGDFATIERLGLDVDAMALIRERKIVLPVIDLQAPKVDAQQRADGTANWTFPSSDGPSDPDAGPKLGTLRIAEGAAHVRIAKLAADFEVTLDTRDSADGQGEIAAKARGTYAKQPITADFVGGALLSLREASTPYPVKLNLVNGPTRVSLAGTVDNPLNFAGTNLKLELTGPDMSLLLPLTGIAIPETPPYSVGGKLDFHDGVVLLQEIDGKVGNSDLGGMLQVDTKPQRVVLTADLSSKLVDLKDLGGFIGAEPGDADSGNKRPVRNTGKVLPDDPINLPKLTVADVHLKYKATRIQGRSQPLDMMRVDMDIVDGNVHLHPLSFAIGTGQIVSDIRVDPQNEKQVRARITIDFNRVDVGKLLAATGVAKGAGTLGGKAVIDGTGRSLAEILGRGNGQLRLFMGRGGNISALLADLSGLQFGNALLSALGIPNRETLMCFALDTVLQTGQATIRTGMLDTEDHRVRIVGGANLRTEAMALTLETEAKHFSIGSLPTPIDVGGTFGAPAISPHIGPLALRGGAAIALGIVGTPLAALLPTIDFGTGEDNACAALVRQAPPRGAAPAPARNRR